MSEELHPTWRTSTASSGNECVAVAFTAEAVLVRDSKHPDGPALSFTLGEWRAFLLGVEAGEFAITAATPA